SGSRSRMARCSATAARTSPSRAGWMTSLRHTGSHSESCSLRNLRNLWIHSGRLERLKRAVHIIGPQRLAVVQAVKNLVNDFLRLLLPIVLDKAVVEVLACQGAADFVLFVVVLKLREVDHLVLALIGGLLVNLEHDPVGLEGHSTNPSAAKKRHLYITNNGCGVNRRAARASSGRRTPTGRTGDASRVVRTERRGGRNPPGNTQV